jgi:Flp pilus assembly protein TadG
MRDLMGRIRLLPRPVPRQRRGRPRGPVLGRSGRGEQGAKRGEQGAKRGEQGAIGVLIGVLIGGGVLMGMGALVIDVGQLYQNRAELQNGADAAALAVAKTCALGTCSPGAASPYANANASKLTGGTAAVDLVCGTSGLAGCPGSTGAMTDCPAPPAGASTWADVHTSTQVSGGSTLLPPAFARTLLGNSGYSGSTVYSCAQAEWGGPDSAVTAAVTFSACEWDQATSGGTSYAPSPPYPPDPSPSYDQVLQLHGTTHGGGSGCPTEPAGADAPGSFGWTDDTGSCSVPVSGPSYGGNTGNNVSQDCQAFLFNAWASRKVIFIPIYVSVASQGTNATYTLKGFAAFVVTGYHMPSFQASDWLNPANNCHGKQFCLNGFFTRALIPSSGGIGGTNLGAEILRLTG